MALNIPSQIRSGDSLNITANISGYSPEDGWVLTVKIVSDNHVYTILGTSSGSNHTINLVPADTQSWAAGQYKYIASVSNGTDKYTIDTSAIRILANIETTTSAGERTHVEKVLSSIEAVLEGKATKDQMEVTFQGRSITHLAPEQLLKWRDKYRAELRNIERAERVSSGLASGRLIKVRF